MVRVSLIIATADRPEALCDLLCRMGEQSLSPCESVIIDSSAKEDARVAACVAGRPEFRHHRTPRNGLPRARNLGIRLAVGDVLLFVDDDIIPHRDLVKYHAAAYSDPGVGGVGGRILGGYDASSDGVGRFFGFEGRVIRNFGATVACDVDHLPGGNMSFRREVFEKIGGFDPSFGGAGTGEETDFCLRARRAGFRLVFEPRAAAEHLHLDEGGGRERGFDRWIFWHAHNGMLFALRHARAAGWPLFVLRRVVRFGLFALEKGSPALLATGLFGLIRGMATYAQGT